MVLSIDASMVPNLLPQEFYKYHRGHILVASICIALLGFVVFLLERTSRSGVGDASRVKPEHKTSGDREVLIWYMRRLWIEGVLERSLYSVARLNLGMQEHEASVAHPKEFIVPQFLLKPGELAAPSVIEDTSANALFAKFGSFVILGPPGSGKTTRIAEFVRELVHNAWTDDVPTLPVALQLASWSVQRGAIADWLVKELKKNLHLPEERVRNLIADSNVVVLLDGLDEVAAKHRSECVAEINRFRADRPGTPIAVSCRKSDYDELPQKLDLDSGIIIQPLTRSEIESSLGRLGSEFSGLKNALTRSPQLYEVLDSPLMMEVAIVTFAGTNTISIAQADDKAELQRMFLRKYVERMLDSQRTRKSYASRRMVPALRWIASNMRNSSQNEFTEQDLVCTVWVRTKRWQIATRALDIVAFSVNGLVWATLFGAVGNLAGHYIHLRAAGLASAFVGGFAGVAAAAFMLFSLNALSVWRIAGRSLYTERAKAMAPRIIPFLTRWSWLVVAVGVMIVLLHWALRIIGMMILIRCAYAFRPGPVIGLSLGAALGVASALGDWYSEHKRRKVAGEGDPPPGINTFLVLLQQDGTKGVMYLLLLLAQLATLIPLAGFLDNLRILSLKGVLWIDGIMPVAHGQLLEGATARAFLRRTGSSYQFIHPLLMDYFATSNRPLSNEAAG